MPSEIIFRPQQRATLTFPNSLPTLQRMSRHPIGAVAMTSTQRSRRRRARLRAEHADEWTPTERALAKEVERADEAEARLYLAIREIENLRKQLAKRPAAAARARR
jgi:hypothetical protein